MNLDKNTTIAQFREEMQHRVVKYPLNSRPVREALRFAKSHEDSAYYRIAADKIHAQRQYQRELNGPGKLERMIDVFAMGSLREVVVTLVLVVGGVVALDASKSYLQGDPDNDMYAKMDIDELASRLGIALESSSEHLAAPAAASNDTRPAAHQQNSDVETPTPKQGAQRLSDGDVARIADAVIRRLSDQKKVSSVAPPANAEQVKLAKSGP